MPMSHLTAPESSPNRSDGRLQAVHYQRYSNRKDIFLQIDGTIYSIPQRLASKPLVDLTKDADPNKPVGESPDDPLFPENISKHEMESFLDVVNASWMDGKPRLSDMGWAGALYTATALDFQSCRIRIIAEMQPRVRELDALKTFELAVRCQVTEWRSWAFQKLCERPEALTADEGRKLGFDITLAVCRIRERLALQARSPCEGRPIPGSWWEVRKNMSGCTCTPCSYVLDMIKAEKAFEI